ncbi:hypothetical protein EIL87_17920 [Saccharopolyspora rhizosphaerae]|uniref:Ig-like domain-containing protein n=1 Tax=Saccharopolyspora rhizosphaerae TaxID=2492662 RepID=A0A3R8Q1U0_9PSEU|nr:hypothetical protein [Saccharopolyspora rhizosphaerae]RRO15140.1 hypothetical protein EIL87_17920 [Saccharopolyspora rhizosphaerae]
MRTAGRKAAGVALIAAFSLGGAAAAQAATAQAVQWNPQNTVEPITLASGTQLVMRSNTGLEVRCSTVSGNVLAPTGGDPAVAGTVNSAGAPAAPTFTDCTNTLAPSATTTVTATGQWLSTATSTSSVDISQASATVNISGVCTVEVDNVTVRGNGWDNGTHQLTANSGESFPISESGFLCDGGTSATLSGTLQLPSEVTIS